MKNMILAIAAALMMSTTISAQDNTSEKRPEMKKMDKTEMVKKRTDETVKRYALNEEQAARLLDLNTKFADKMGPRRGQRPEGMRGDRKMRPDSARNFMRQESEANDGQERKERRRMGEGRQDFRKQMEEYDAEIQKIMTEEQFKNYKADREKRMKEGPRGQRK